MCACVRACVLLLWWCARARARVRVSLCVRGTRRERGRQRRFRARIGQYGPANTEGSRWGQRTMLGSDETRRTAANCRRTLLFAMRPLNGHTITASMRTSARSATAAQNGAKCQLGSAASIVVILAVAGSREDRGSADGSNRSGSKDSLSAMGQGAVQRIWVALGLFAETPNLRALLTRSPCSSWCCHFVIQQRRWQVHASAAE